MSAIRPLPARPNLEFEHNEAKAFLRQLKAGDEAALSRARAIDSDISRETVQLADAQRVIAREYGFISWPKLVKYFTDSERQAHAGRSGQEPEHLEQLASGLLRQLQAGRRDAARTFAAFVPRLYGKPIDEVIAGTVTVDEARLATARRYAFPSWQAMLERTARDRDEYGRRVPPKRMDPFSVAFAAERGTLESIVTKYPDQLDAMLIGGFHMRPETVRFLIGKGANPNWVAPNGITVLEHALIRYWNGAAVDVLLERVVPRKALWIAAGVGDVNGVREYLDANGAPTAEAREQRPDFIAIGPMGAPQYPDATDEEILMEALFVAVLNGRGPVIEYLASRGVDVNSMVWETPLLNVAVGNAWQGVEALLRCGADPDIKGHHPDSTAREMARMVFEGDPQNPDRRRTIELLGMSPDAILAEQAARPAPEPEPLPELREALALAGDDAARQGHQEITPENLLWGMLRRIDGLGEGLLTRVSRMDYERFRNDHAARLLPADQLVERSPIPFDEAAQKVFKAAIALAKESKREAVTTSHLLYAMLTIVPTTATELLSRYGGKYQLIAEIRQRSM